MMIITTTTTTITTATTTTTKTTTTTIIIMLCFFLVGRFAVRISPLAFFVGAPYTYVRFAKTLWQDYTGCFLAFLTNVSVEVFVHQAIVGEVGHGSRHLVLCANFSNLSDMIYVLDVC